MRVAQEEEEKTDPVYVKAAEDLMALAVANPEAAKKYVSETIDWLFNLVTNFYNDLQPIFEAGEEARGQGVGMMKKIKIAKNAESLMKGLGEKYKPYMLQIQQSRPQITACMMFCGRDEYIDEQAKIVSIILNAVGSLQI
jgi:hypothetical protein